jgi:integrase
MRRRKQAWLHGVRLIIRERGGLRRIYADFRPYGGKREALVAPGDSRATADREIAEKLIEARLVELQDAHRAQVGIRRAVGLEAFARRHLLQKAAGQTTERWMKSAEIHLGRACDFFGTERDLITITVADVGRWVEHLRRLPGKGGGAMADGTVRHHVNTLSNLYRRAQSEGQVPPGFNPVASILPGEKPAGRAAEARWLEVPDAALLLEAARTTQIKRPDLALGCLHPLLATFLLTGGRRAEALGLEVDDVSFTRKTVTFRPNGWRRLKTSTSARVVPLWPQLEEILSAYLSERSAAQVLDGAPMRRLLFPRRGPGPEVMITNFDAALDQVAIAAGLWEYVIGADGQPVKDKAGQPKRRGTVRSKRFRHTYCSARLQTLDHGAPVSTYTVSRELGHGSTAMVERVYAHLGSIRHRSEVVEYRVEQHAEALGERLTRLADARRPRLASPDGSQNGTTDGTTESSQSRKSFARP